MSSSPTAQESGSLNPPHSEEAEKREGVLGANLKGA
jgi:hypothetical protein